jgi:hypothetical protein
VLINGRRLFDAIHKSAVNDRRSTVARPATGARLQRVSFLLPSSERQALSPWRSMAGVKRYPPEERPST